MLHLNGFQDEPLDLSIVKITANYDKQNNDRANYESLNGENFNIQQIENLHVAQENSNEIEPCCDAAFASAQVPAPANPETYTETNNICALSSEFQSQLNDLIIKQAATGSILFELQKTVNGIAVRCDAVPESYTGLDYITSILGVRSTAKPEGSAEPQAPAEPQTLQSLFTNVGYPYIFEIPANDVLQSVVNDSEREEVEEEDDDEDEEYFANPPKQARMEYDAEYPREVGLGPKKLFIIGPNSTIITKEEYNAIPFNSAAVATRALLNIIFSNEELATHTLSGKPSPAFHGRERPTKIQLDPLKVADIIHCVMVNTNCKERDVRATITTKCADAAKLYKKRHNHKS